MNFLFKKGRFFLAAFWVFFVVFWWFKSHFSTLQSGGFKKEGLFLNLIKNQPLIEKILPLIVVAIISLSLFLFIFYYKRQKTIQLSFYGLEIIFLAILLSMIFFNMHAFQITPDSNTRLIDIENLLSANIHFLAVLLSQIFWIIGLILILFLLGKIVKNKLNIKIKTEDRLFEILSILTLGLFILTIIIFILGLFGFINHITVLLIAFLVLSLELGSAKGIIKYIFRLKEITINLKDYSVLIWIIIFFIFILNLTDSLRPVPVGYDDANNYLNRVRLMGENGRIISGGFPFAFELIATIGQVLSKNAILPIGVNVLMSIFGMLAIYGLGRYFFDKKSGVIMAGIWYSLPITWHFIRIEVKPDLMMFFLSVMATWSFFIWIKEKNKHSYLFLCLFFAGFALTVKLTAIFLFFSFLAGLVLSWKYWKEINLIKAKTLILSLVFFIIPVVPWMILSAQSNGFSLPNAPLEIISSENKETINRAKELSFIGVNSCNFTGLEEDIKKFLGERDGIKKFLYLPWDITMNTSATMISTEIGFIFLSLLILIPIFFKEIMDSRIVLIIVMATVYWISWLILGRFVIWYGYSGFIFLIILISLFFKNNFKPKWLKMLFVFILFLSMAMNMLLRLYKFGENNSILYTGGILTSEEAYFPNIRKILQLVNENYNEKVWVTAGIFPYFIANNDRMMFDSYLDIFNCIDKEKNDEIMLSQLQKLKYRYLIINTNMLSMEKNLNGTLHEKVKRVYDFASKKLRLKSYYFGVYLFEIPN